MVDSKSYPILKLTCNHSSRQTHAHLNNSKNREISNPRVFAEQCNTHIRLFSVVLAQTTAAMCFHTHCGSSQEPNACWAWPQAPQNNGVTIVFQLTTEAGHTSCHLVTALPNISVIIITSKSNNLYRVVQLQSKNPTTF